MAIGTTIFIPGSAGVGKYLNTILSGKANPVSAAGNVGDFWLNTLTYVLYGPKQGDNWPATGVSLIGPEGSGNGGGSSPSAAIVLGHGAPPDSPAPIINSLYFDLDSGTVYPAV